MAVSAECAVAVPSSLASIDQLVRGIPSLKTTLRPTEPLRTGADYEAYIGTRTIHSPEELPLIWDRYQKTGYFVQFPRLFVHGDTKRAMRALMAESAWVGNSDTVVDLGGWDTSLIEVFNPRTFLATDFSPIACHVGGAEIDASRDGSRCNMEMRQLDLGSSAWGLEPGSVSVWNSFMVMSPMPAGAIEHQLRLMHAYSSNGAEAFVALMLEGFNFGEVMRNPRTLGAVLVRNAREMVSPGFIKFLRNSGPERRKIQMLVDRGDLIYPPSGFVLDTAHDIGWEVVDARLSVDLGEPSRAMVAHLRKA